MEEIRKLIDDLAHAHPVLFFTFAFLFFFWLFFGEWFASTQFGKRIIEEVIMPIWAVLVVLIVVGLILLGGAALFSSAPWWAALIIILLIIIVLFK